MLAILANSSAALAGEAVCALGFTTAAGFGAAITLLAGAVPVSPAALEFLLARVVLPINERAQLATSRQS
jgi:hypothetical protein